MQIPKYRLSEEELERIDKNRWLTVRERRVFEMYYRDGKRIEDIAAELDINRRTVDRTLAKIRSGAKMSLKCR